MKFEDLPLCKDCFVTGETGVTGRKPRGNRFVKVSSYRSHNSGLGRVEGLVLKFIG